MNNHLTTDYQPVSSTFISPGDLLLHWQGHRSLTRKAIEAFPEKDLFGFSIGGMRPFAELAMEMINMATPGVYGSATSEWKTPGKPDGATEPLPASKEALLELWDNVTDTLDTVWPQIKPERFAETDVAFGLYEGTIYSTILYFIDNEVHHRGQGFVYLRALGIEPPPFWDRS